MVESSIKKTEESHVMVEENDELKNELETEMFELSLEQAEIDVSRNGSVAVYDLEESKDQETVEKVDLDEERSGKVTESSSSSSSSSSSISTMHEEVKVSESVEEKAKDQSNHSNNDERVLISYPIRPDEDDCAHFMKFGNCEFTWRCVFNHPPARITNQQLVLELSSEVRTVVEVSIKRVWQPECKYDMTPEGCKKESCRYYHQGSDNSSMYQAAELNLLGLPIRVGEKECERYMRYGLCKYRSKCRFHHPEPTTLDEIDSGYGNDNESSLPASPLVPSSSTLSSSVSSPTRTAPPNKYWDGYQLPWSGQRALTVKDRFLKTLKGILNNPACKNLHLLNGGLIKSAVTSADDLKDIASLIWDKAISEPTFCPMYGLICSHLNTWLPGFPSDELGGKKITFKRVLFSKCQEVFENAGKLREEVKQISAPEQEQERRDKEKLLKVRTIGNIRLVGELMKHMTVNLRNVYDIVQELLGTDDKICPAEENVEAVCHLFNTLGKYVDKGPASELNDKYFDRLKELSTSPQLTARVRFMVRDVIDLRANNWIPRR